MSDIDLRSLDGVIYAFVTFCFVGPSLLAGILFLIIGCFVRKPKAMLVAYLATGTVATGAVLTWLAIWQIWTLVLIGAFPIGFAISAAYFGLWLLLLWALRKVGIYRRR